MQWENELYGRLSDCVKVTFMLREFPFHYEQKGLVKDLKLQKKYCSLLSHSCCVQGLGLSVHDL